MVMSMVVAVMVAMTVVVTVVMMLVVVMRPMIMGRVIVMMIVHGVMVAAGIGATFRIERRLDFDHARAQPLHHRLDDMIAADPKPLRHDLRRQVTVAEMPGDPDQMVRIAAANLDQRLSRGHYLDQASIFEHQRISAAQRNRGFEIKQEFEPARARHRHPPSVPIVEIEHDGVGRRLGPAVLCHYLGCANHG
jgi:hypothetical protein